MDRVYVYSLLGLVGRLGNQLWQVAATLNHAERDPESRAAVPADWEYRPYLRFPDAFYRAPYRTEEVIDVARLPEGPYFQALEYFADVAPRIRELFSPSDYGEERLRAHHGPVLHSFRDGPGHLTAMHIRRTDYLEYPDKFPQLSSAYYTAAVKTVMAEVGDTTVVVFSDDIGWCQQNVEYLGLSDVPHMFMSGHVRPIPPRARIGEPADIFDLWLMSYCDAHIIANSSFSWWGAWLSEQKLVIYPDRWFGADAQHSEKMWGAFAEHWRQIPC